MCRQQVLQDFCTYAEHDGEDRWLGVARPGKITKCSAARRTGTCAAGVQDNSIRTKVEARCRPCEQLELQRQEQFTYQENYYNPMPDYDDIDDDPNYTYSNQQQQ
ncbi:hypothetical protein PFICI_02432 [Pestalotiopsis fici W106-1]|uniref:Uncharacterized protein n=1 Tax=Pestalotiopsis fici (strain W106-1 / CGMCC3.15140) TaxID=1229662 RepID=W3XG60_PESFW|nr:uncharacterized protein PFICI_02432 [Pestalotiopsis fici W106-1]ETS84407.1 hypothetical protein PFICI_02432 [Pestalotiopsis fici W106-1]